MLQTRDPQVGKCAVRQDAELRGQADGAGGLATADGLPIGEATSPPVDDAVVLATFWSWPSLLLVRLSPKSVGPDCPDSLMLVAPDNRGLRELEVLDSEIESMWLIQPPLSGGGQLHTEEIRKVGPWPVTATPKDRSTSFHCVSGAVFVMRQGHMLRVEERGMHWSSGGKFSLNCRPGEP